MALKKSPCGLLYEFLFEFCALVARRTAITIDKPLNRFKRFPVNMLIWGLSRARRVVPPIAYCFSNETFVEVDEPTIFAHKIRQGQRRRGIFSVKNREIG